MPVKPEDSVDKQVQELREALVKAEIHSERTQFITRFVVPLLTAAVVGLFTWIWTTSQSLVQIRSDVEKASASAVDRYTQTEADHDIPELRTWIRRVEDDVDKINNEKIPGQSNQIIELKTRLDVSNIGQGHRIASGAVWWPRIPWRALTLPNSPYDNASGNLATRAEVAPK